MKTQKKHTITFLPSGITASAWECETISTAAARAGVPLAHYCGGAGKCGKCRINGVKESFTPITETEKRLLSPQNISEGGRLACCTYVIRDCDILVIDEATCATHRLLHSTARDIPLDWAPDSSGYGVAVDLGTTSVACFLLDMEKCTLLDSLSFLNPQVIFGSDVISRIAYADSQQDGLEQMRKIIVRGINEAVLNLTERNGICPADVSQIVVAANTVMEHVLMNISPCSMGKSPYTPAFLEFPIQRAQDIELEIAPNGRVKLIPNVAAYVGGDVVAGTEALHIANDSRVRLLIDIGTNNEMVLGNNNSLFCCATAAGPALEGARIECGIMAKAGAIEKIFLDTNELRYTTIDDIPAIGLCGSGLIELLAQLLDAGIVEKNGHIDEKKALTDPRFSNRISREGEKKILRLFIARGDRDVFLTQKDIREIQLAIGAIRVGIDVLLEKMKIGIECVDEILLAGAFGNGLDIKSAISVGLLPKVPMQKIKSVQNTAGLGACMALASADFYQSTINTAKKMRYIELSTLPDFQNRFIKSLNFEG